jgi:hypothetical protein
LRVPKSGVLPDLGIGLCLRQTPETAASMPQHPCRSIRGYVFYRKVEKVKEVRLFQNYRQQGKKEGGSRGLAL